MSSYRSIRVDRTTAERLLAGRPVAAGAGTLTAVLRAAAAPAHPAELVREAVALTAFRYADAVPEPRRPLRTAVAKVLTVKAAVVLAAFGSTGVVFAALPGPWADSPATPPATSPPADPSTPPPVTRTSRPSDTGTPTGTEPGATPSPSPTGQCRPGEKRCADEHPADRPSAPAESTHGNAPNTRPTTSSRPESPDSHAPGADPPAGAEPPSQGD